MYRLIHRPATENNMHKLVTIALYGHYLRGPVYPLSHGSVEEHLSQFLEQGWRVVSVTSVGVAVGDICAFGGWLAVLLERNAQ
jgi:hypothetical protein